MMSILFLFYLFLVEEFKALGMRKEQTLSPLSTLTEVSVRGLQAQ